MTGRLVESTEFIKNGPSFDYDKHYLKSCRKFNNGGSALFL